MKKKGSTTENIQKRRKHLAMILPRLRSEGRHPTLHTLKDELKKIKIAVEISTISEDLKEINKENSFVKDIAQCHYSSLCEDSVHNIFWIYSEAKKQYQTSKDAKSKNAFLNTMMNAEKTVLGAINGKMTDVSVALLQHEFDKLRQENEDLKAQNANHVTQKDA